MTHHDTNTNDVKLLREKIKGIRVAMLTTLEEDGTLRSRPMATQDMDFVGDLWFFTQADAPKVDEVQQHRQVNISYAKPDDNLYVSVSGTAQLVRDRQKIEELWKPSPFLKIWFPKGKDDPNLALLQVSVTSAEYWDSSSNKMMLLFNAMRAAATGNEKLIGENKKLDVK
jgi:general stress protein 26